MPRITDIEVQQRRSERVSVYLDGEFWTGLPADLAGMLGLKIGDELSSERKVEVEAQIAEEAALGAATHLLSYRDRSESEMQRRLQEKGFGEEVVKATVRRLQEYGYLDDDAFARQLAETQLARGRGRRAAQQALREAGLAPEVMEAALHQVYQDTAEHEAAQRWLERKPVPSTPQERQKLVRGLAGRGFSYDVAQAAVRRHEAGEAG